MLYQLLTGRLPYLAPTRDEYLNQLLHRPPRPLRTIDDQIDPEIERICLKCLAKNVDDRDTTCLDLAGDLQRFLDRPQAPEPVAIPQSKTRFQSALAAIAALVIIGVGVAGWRQWATSAGKSETTSTEPRGNEGGNTTDAVQDGTGENNPPSGKALAVGEWSSLFVQPPTMFYWPTASGRERPTFDPEEKTYRVRSDLTHWIAAAGTLKPDDFEVRMGVHLKEWSGQVGVVWQLAEDPNAFPRKGYRCYAVEYARKERKERAKLWRHVYSFAERSFDDPTPSQTETVDSREVAIPITEWVSLRVTVQDEKIRVNFNDEPKWIVHETIADTLAREPGATTKVGLTGMYGDSTIRDLAIRYLPD